MFMDLRGPIVMALGLILSYGGYLAVHRWLIPAITWGQFMVVDIFCMFLFAIYRFVHNKLFSESLPEVKKPIQ
jgi:hypothetical protein